MAGAIKNATEKFKQKVRKVVFKISLRTPLNSYRFHFILVAIALWNVYRYRAKIESIARYKKAINNSQLNIIFIFNCFMAKSYGRIFPHLLAENPGRYMKYICIEGKDYVRQLMDEDTGVILISGHFGPMFRSFLFKEAFGKDVSSFANADYKKKVFNAPAKLYKINSSFPYYAVGEEKQFQEGLLRGEWINILNDVPVKKRDSNNQTLFGKNIYLSELPFKVAIKYNIPILFVGITRNKRQYTVSIRPIDEFNTPKEGLGKYIALLAELLCNDPYASMYIAENHF
jgi:lauroyl/myristoyl acyltransferase